MGYRTSNGSLNSNLKERISFSFIDDDKSMFVGRIYVRNM